MLPDVLLNETEKSFRDEVRAHIKDNVSSDFVKAMDRDEIRYPRDYVKSLGDAGLLGPRFPKEYGGRGLPWTAEIAAEEEVGVLGTALACAYVMPSIVGEALVSFGSDALKEKYLKPILKGDLISAEALTEPRGGSDFFGATTHAKSDGDHLILNGQKRFVVGAEGADCFAVYCVTNPEGKPHERLSLLMVDRDAGVEVKYLYGLMGTRGGGTGRLVFHDVRVPKSNIIGPMGGGALVFDRMMIPERLTSAAGCLGGARAALEIATRYSNRRHAFGRKIRKFQAVSHKIADSITQLDAARALVYAAARTVDLEMPHRRLVSQAKKFATEMNWKVVNDAMQVMGGIGYTDIYPIEKAIRDARLSMIWTGTNEVMEALIQHEYYEETLVEEQSKRNIEHDAINADDEMEKCYTDEDMWKEE